jgi:cell division protein FtsB
MATTDELLSDIVKLERQSRRSLPLTIAVLIVVLGALAYSSIKLIEVQRKLSAADVALAAKLKQVNEADAKLKTATENVARYQTANQELLKVVEDQRRTLRDYETIKTALNTVRPSSVNLILPSESARTRLAPIKEFIDHVSDRPSRILVLPTTESPPYAIEVRYFRHPQDLKVAQALVYALQSRFNMPLSRTSFVRDQREPKAIDIVFNKAAFQ